MMVDVWDEMLSDLDGGTDYWRKRLTMAETLMDAFKTGQIVEATPTIRQLLLRLVDDSKWEVRKVIANGLNLIEDSIFDELSTKLLADANSFVKRSAEQSYAMRRRDHRRNRKREVGDRQLISRLSKIREKYGSDAVEDVIAVSEIRFNLLAGAMAHDLRSILTHLQPAARGLSDALDDDVDLITAQRKAGRIVDSLNFIDRCVSDMERYTEPLPIQQQPEDLAEVLKIACDMAEKNIEELGFDSNMVALQLEVPDGLRLRLSRHLMVLAVTNLVKNAYESFMKRHEQLRCGKITITACNSESDTEIVIRDDGMGMTAEDMDDLSSGLPRRRNKAKRKSTGFGVPLARRYIEAHGGTLIFESDEDVGTTATITLPRTQSCILEEVI
ncbi:MAG: HAMP domain-containing histidine kinase [Sedimentisphaerales bacterium]|nr:HAMP domain-containing histidine kinase [Sedimentisphaerales bacterium]